MQPLYSISKKEHMKIYALDIKENVDGKIVIGKSSTREVSVEEMKSRMSKSLAMLSLRRITARKSKDYNKSVLEREIGMTD
ncbi:hypothetical protein FACS1894155_11130 [Bacteroidia bacterium]|nr:hypothetical protein FACS1894155_11130 [Bacteroidia bacterium]